MKKEKNQSRRDAGEAAWAAFLRTGAVEQYLAYRGYKIPAGRGEPYASVHRRTDR